MNYNLKLDVLIATHGPRGLEMVAKQELPKSVGVRYLVSWQSPGENAGAIPDALRRDDIVIETTDSTGSSANRNDLMRRAEAPYCIFSDNDISYLHGALDKVVAVFESNPDLDVAQFMYANARKKYPNAEVDLVANYPAGHIAATFELAFRRESVVGKVWMNENFGIGRPLACAEDNIFLLDCRRAGLQCRFIPLPIMTHDGTPTGGRPISDSAVARGEGGFIRYTYGRKGALRVPLAVWRNFRRGRLPFWWGLRHYVSGFLDPKAKSSTSAQNI